MINHFHFWLMQQTRRKDHVGKIAAIVAKLPPGCVRGKAAFGAILGALSSHRRLTTARYFWLKAAHREWLSIIDRRLHARDANQQPVPLPAGGSVRLMSRDELLAQHRKRSGEIWHDE